ncbi:LysR family transcriptional regulator [Bradyrhizobium erythrophlei]|uniref:DNA-binding transcriptional regulator, LysR family n=1 Tax=Bradyrhizobium erythrophlei TaxID=1437360 RepID=A0A1H4Z1M0_9BRAD|nr:LysR family transcriptional regulator [Bradyrhizobium erythrophlei]SED23795.1 DNA-binding transcriptional regulator, LysR family [Bradyrhizobium erythrophlei]
MVDNAGTRRQARRKVTIGLQHLRFAVLANDCGSLRRAAEMLTVRHSAMSRSIGQFEHLIGARLFERSSAGIKPTLAGKGVIRMARVILEQLDALVATGRSIGRGQTGRISVGLYTSISAGNLRNNLIDFRKRFPHLELGITERPRAHLLNALRSGAIDVLVVTGDARSMDNKTLKLWSERIFVSLPEGHPLQARDIVYWTDLRNETVLLSHHDLSRELEDVIISKLVSAGDRPKIERHDASRSFIKSLVSMGLGVSLMLESDAGASFDDLVYREIRDGTGSSRIEYSAQWRSDNENPALQSFLQLLLERYPSSTRAE